MTKSNSNVFEFLINIPRSEIRNSMVQSSNKIRCPILLLGLMEYKLEKEIEKKKITHSKSYILELLYLFDDFMSKEYRVIVLEEVSHICTKNK